MMGNCLPVKEHTNSIFFHLNKHSLTSKEVRDRIMIPFKGKKACLIHLPFIKPANLKGNLRKRKKIFFFGSFRNYFSVSSRNLIVHPFYPDFCLFVQERSGKSLSTQIEISLYKANTILYFTSGSSLIRNAWLWNESIIGSSILPLVLAL